MKDTLLIGGPKSLNTGVDRIDDDLLSILEAPEILSYPSVIVWPTSEFLKTPSDYKKLRQHADMNSILMETAYSIGLLKDLSPQSDRDEICATTEQKAPSMVKEQIITETLRDAVCKLAELTVASTTGMKLVTVISKAAPKHSLCWTGLADSWTASTGTTVKRYDTKSDVYGILNSVLEWNQSFSGLAAGTHDTKHLLPLGDTSINRKWVTIEDKYFPDAANALRSDVTVEYPVINRLGAPMAIKAYGSQGYMLIVPEPAKPKNFLIGLKTGSPSKQLKKTSPTTQPAPTSAEVFLTRKEVAELLKTSERTVDRYVADGKLEAKKVGRKVLLVKASVDKLLGN